MEYDTEWNGMEVSSHMEKNTPIKRPRPPKTEEDEIYPVMVVMEEVEAFASRIPGYRHPRVSSETGRDDGFRTGVLEE